MDAALYLRNPFFNVPIYHLIQQQDGFTQPLDLKAIASERARIEVYDEDDQLVFIDHNGDGDLLDPGDLLLSDKNGDGFGDLNITRAGARCTRFLVQVTPDGNLPKEGLTIRYQTRDASGVWNESSRDLITPGPK